MPDKKKEDSTLSLVESILKKSYQEFKEIQLDDSELKSIIYNSKIYLHQIKGNRRCSYKYCRNSAVMSHLFQQSILKKISKDGHLLYPAYDCEKSQIKLQKVGVANALLFPGYCQKHEGIFSYEKKERIEYLHEQQKLIYKVICYQHVYWEETYKKLQRSIDLWQLKKHQEFWRSNGEKYDILLQTIGVKFKSFKFSDSKHKSFLKLLKSVRTNINEAKKFKELIWKDIKSEEEVCLKTFTVSVDEVLPICLSYLGELNLKKDNKKFKETVCFIIHPYKTTTSLSFSVEAKKYDKLVYFLKDSNNEKVWELILSSLAFVSDNWLINQDFYEDLPSDLKRLLENARCLPIIKE